jgi:hypothetical protein
MSPPPPPERLGGAAPGTPLDHSGAAALVGVIAALICGAWMIFFLPIFFLALFAIAFAHCAWACNLTANYWRPANSLLWVPWILSTWVSITLTFLMPMLMVRVFTNQENVAIVFVIFPLVSAGAAFFLRNCRSDTVLVLSLAAPAVLGLTGLGIAVYCFAYPQANSFGIPIIVGAGCAFIAMCQALPPAIALIYLKIKGLFRTTPFQLTPNCGACQYDLTGSAMADQALCPECGKAIPLVQRMWINQNQNAPTSNTGQTPQ